MYYIDFSAITAAYDKDEAARHDFHSVFSAVGSFLYWQKIQEFQRIGLNQENAPQIERVKDSFCEKPEYVQNRVISALLKVIRFSTALNSDLARRGHNRFIIRPLKRSEDGLWSLMDAQNLACEIAFEYKTFIGKELLDTRWDLR